MLWKLTRKIMFKHLNKNKITLHSQAKWGKVYNHSTVQQESSVSRRYSPCNRCVKLSVYDRSLHTINGYEQIL